MMTYVRLLLLGKGVGSVSHQYTWLYNHPVKQKLSPEPCTANMMASEKIIMHFRVSCQLRMRKHCCGVHANTHLSG